MKTGLDPAEIRKMKDEARGQMKEVLEELRKDHPKAVEAAAVAVGGTLGGAASYTALYFAGTAGLSAAGMTSGLATAGALVGGGMAAGVSVLAAPVAVFAIAGYAIAKRRRNAKLAAAVKRATGKLYSIQERLIANAQYFREELAEIKEYIDEFSGHKPKANLS